jgi:mRNA interferase MazF
VTYKRWDVVVVPYPFIDVGEVKHRPALIVSGEDLHRSHGVYWIAMITTAKAGRQPDDILVTNHAQAGLPENCVIRVKRLTALNETQISRRIGTITAKDRRAVGALLKKYLP